MADLQLAFIGHPKRVMVNGTDPESSAWLIRVHVDAYRTAGSRAPLWAHSVNSSSKEGKGDRFLGMIWSALLDCL